MLCLLWCMISFIIMKCPSGIFTFFILKSISSNISTATLTFLWMPCAWNIISHPFTLSFYLSLELRCVSWRQNMVGFCFIIHSATLCIFIGEFSPFTFGVIIEIWVLLIAILSFALWQLSISIASLSLCFCFLILVAFCRFCL